MIYAEDLLRTLKKNKVNFYTGVPDSVLKHFINLLEKLGHKKHIGTFNEGSAVSLAIGNYLSTQKIPCVYLQNSGLGNAINPLISIAHSKVYSIPLLLIIGWRGSPFVNSDEPQHNEKGKITRQLLKLVGIRYIIIRSNKDLKKIKKLLNFSIKNLKPVSILIEKNILTKKKVRPLKVKKQNGINRSIFITSLLKLIKNNTKIVSTTGYTSRELNQIREQKKLNKGKDFYMVGGMGHSLMVSLGKSLGKKENVICLDGDGSILMHLGSLRTSGLFGRKNLKHIIFNNSCHESVGGQPTYSEDLDFVKISKTFGYKNAYKINNYKNLNKNILRFLKSPGPSLLEIITKKESMKNLKRPKNFNKIKNLFMV